MSIELDSQIIYSLLQEENPEDSFSYLEGSGFVFSQQNIKVYEFIKNFYKTYKKLPSLEIVKEHFPGFKHIRQTAPLAYYVEKIFKQHRINSLSALVSAINKALMENDTEKALQLIERERTKLHALHTKSQDINVKNDADTLIDEKIKGLGKGVKKGLMCGIKTIDESTFGFFPGDFVILAGYTNSGKTWMLLYFLYHMVKNYDGTFVFFSKEMTKQQIFQRFLAIVGEENFSDIRSDNITKERLEVIKEKIRALKGNVIIIGAEEGVNYDINYIRMKLAKYKPSAAFIDGLYMFNKSVDWKDQSGDAAAFKDLAMQYNCPVIGTTQFNNEFLKQRRPTLNNLAYSTGYAYYANTVIGLVRLFDEVKQRPSKIVHMHLIKSRESEAGIVVKIAQSFIKSRIIEDCVTDPDGDEWVVPEDVSSDDSAGKNLL